MMTVHHHDFPCRCPFCNLKLEAATNVGPSSEAPEDGGITMCFKCGEFSVFALNEPGKLRKPTDEEYAEIGTSPLLQKMRKIWLRSREPGATPPPGDKRRKMPTPEDMEKNLESGSMFGDMALADLFEHFHTAFYGPIPPDDKRVKAELFKWFMLGAASVIHEMNHMPKRGPEEGKARFKALGKEVAAFSAEMFERLKGGNFS